MTQSTQNLIRAQISRFLLINWPVLFLALLLSGYLYFSSYVMQGRAPYYRDYDPEMAYFANSLAIFKGLPYHYADHPGIPVEIIGTLLLAISLPFFKNLSDFFMYYIQNPDTFLNLAHGFVTAASIVCAGYFYVTSQRQTQHNRILTGLALALMFYGLHDYAFTTLTLWSHTSFNFPLGTFYLLFLFNVATRGGSIKRSSMIWLGLGAGFLVAVMINFVPWLVGTLIFILVFYRLQQKAWKQVFQASAIFLTASAGSFLVSVLPAIQRMPYFFDFIFKLFNHTLPYGAGPEGITTLPLLSSNFRSMFTDSPLLFLSILAAFCLAIYLLVLQRDRIALQPGLWGLSAGLSVMLILGILEVMKHPGPRFLLQLAATLPVFFLVIWKLSAGYKPLEQSLSAGLVMFSFAAILYSGSLSLINKQSDINWTRNYESQANSALAEISSAAGKKPGQEFIIWSNVTYSYCSVRLYANFYASGVFSTETENLCPNQAIFFFKEMWDWTYYHGQPTPLTSLPWDLAVTLPEFLEGNPAWNKLGTVRIFPIKGASGVAILERTSP